MKGNALKFFFNLKRIQHRGPQSLFSITVELFSKIPCLSHPPPPTPPPRHASVSHFSFLVPVLLLRACFTNEKYDLRWNATYVKELLYSPWRQRISALWWGRQAEIGEIFPSTRRWHKCSTESSHVWLRPLLLAD